MSSQQAPHPTGNAIRSFIVSFIAECQDERKKRLAYARFWNIADVAIGVPAVGLAAVAGVSALSEIANQAVAGSLALGAAICTATAGFLQCRTRYLSNKRGARAWRVLEWDARLALATYDEDFDIAATKKSLAELVARRRSLLDDDYVVVFGTSQQEISGTSDT